MPISPATVARCPWLPGLEQQLNGQWREGASAGGVVAIERSDAGGVGVAGMRRRRLAAYDSAVSSSLPPPKVTVVRRADQAAFKSLLLDTCATPRPHPLAVPA